MQKGIFFFFILATFFIFSCQERPKEVTNNQDIGGVNTLVVKEVITGASYTYVRGDFEGEESWFAMPINELTVGKTYFFDAAIVMRDFESKELSKTFEIIYFIDDIRDTPDPKENSDKNTELVNNQVAKDNTAKVEKIAGGMSIAELYEKASSVDAQTMVIKGKVVKVSNNIMETNWIHIQDGTEFNGNYDLTVTTLSDVTVGEIVKVKGQVAIDKDFGAGYFYKVIVLDADVIGVSQ